ncbi:MAG: inorganic diphosphatase [Pseudomonadota bacterium]
MDLQAISPGTNPPSDINVVIEIPMRGTIKYEVDKQSGAVFVDRFLATSMQYPCNYGFIPGTLSDDGDPADVLVVCQDPLAPGSVIRARPVGVLLMDDEAGQDEKIIAVPHSKITRLYDTVSQIGDLPEMLLDQITHFFEHYKDLEHGKWVKVGEWGSSDQACDLITTALGRANQA